MTHRTHRLLILGIVFTSICTARPGRSQDPLTEQKTRGLKCLGAVAVVVRPNTPREIATPKELSDMVEVALHRSAPEIILLDDTTKAKAWLELSIITTDEGGV